MSQTHLLSQEQLHQFNTDGFLILSNFFDVEKELGPVVESINTLVDNLANDLFKGGKIKDKCESEGFYTRLSKIEAQFPGSAVLLHKKGVLPAAIAQLWSNERLLDVIEQILGPNIAGHPVWNLRTKTPFNPSVTVPWHQDAAYLMPGSENTLQPTAWVPLIDANMVNGCMQVYKGGHLPAKLCEHTCCAGPSWYIDIDEEELKKTLGEREIVTCEVPMGSILLINQLIPHRSLENKSDKIRWSVDLRWQRPSEPHGFFGIKDPILMRSEDNRNMEINWDQWGKQDRNALWDEKSKGPQAPAKTDGDDEFNTVITGPWMSRWKVTHTNKHTEAFNPDQEWTGWHKS